MNERRRSSSHPVYRDVQQLASIHPLPWVDQVMSPAMSETPEENQAPDEVEAAPEEAGEEEVAASE